MNHVDTSVYMECLHELKQYLPWMKHFFSQATIVDALIFFSFNDFCRLVSQYCPTIEIKMNKIHLQM